MTILDYYEGIARIKERERRAEYYRTKHDTPRTMNELFSKYYRADVHFVSRGANDKRKECRYVLRDGVTRGDYEREMEKLFPKEYALKVILPEMKANYPWCYESAKQYRTMVTEIKTKYDLEGSQVREFYALK